MSADTGTMGSEPKSKGNGTSWAAARAYWLALPPERRTYAAVAKRFGVSDVRVGKIARRDRWLDAAMEADQLTDEQMVRWIARTRAERLQKTLEIYDRANDKALEQLRRDQLEVKLADLPGLFKMAELAAGEATDRVALTDVQPVLIAFAKIAVVNATPENRGRVLRELEAASSGIVALGDAT